MIEGVKMLKKYLVLVLILFSLVSNLSFSWNTSIYNEILKNVVSSLPEDLSVIFLNKDIKESVNEFLRWNEDFGKKEHLENPIHFFSTESYGSTPEIIKENLLAMLGRKKIEDKKKGTLFWTVLRYVNATMDLAETNVNSFPRMLGLLIHFVTDLNSPLHATKYVDGKTKAQKGLHYKWENIVSKKLFDLGLKTVIPEQIDDLNGYVLDALIRSWSLSEKLFEIENQVAQEIGRSSGNYSEVLYEKTKDIARQQLQNSIKMVADIIYTAYEKAKLSNSEPYNVSIIKVYPWGNDRYVEIKNLGKKALNIKGWKLYCFSHETGIMFNYFEFLRKIISPSEKIKIHSGPSAFHLNRGNDLFWTLKRIWSTHDEALLEDNNGKIVDLYVY